MQTTTKIFVWSLLLGETNTLTVKKKKLEDESFKLTCSVSQVIGPKSLVIIMISQNFVEEGSALLPMAQSLNIRTSL